mmetsp:Transcript_102087/g.161077  ORF Transcript_102087/g.161077 Transcript_102087/m.161077 type:complete len:606 (+) Transcript_102087:53-1870(+)
MEMEVETVAFEGDTPEEIAEYSKRTAEEAASRLSQGLSAPRNPDHPFKGRSVSVVNDLSVNEQMYLYRKAQELREAVEKGKDLTPFRINDRQACVYTIFMEDSTRTKESFRNAAEFHGLKVNMFDSKSSSFQKNETITDTIKMLCGYSIGQSTFVIRSKIEGVCTWLEDAIGGYTRQQGLSPCSFVNAGDGRHEHPTQEFLDEFSFLEQKGWDTESIHLVLLGDLFHGRTVHSKVDGLRLYKKVEVDLVAPPELALPSMYEDRMVAEGYVVRKFGSIDEYLAQPKVAKLWYFTRLQLERMGDKVLDRQMDLRRCVSFRRDFLDKLPDGCKFYHPLPRDARFPTLPFWLDNSELNGWDRQSQNGYFTRIVLLGMLMGHFGSDFILERKPSIAPASPPAQANKTIFDLASDFAKEKPAENAGDVQARSREIGLVPIASGVVIDRLAEGQNIDRIWGLMYMVRSSLKIYTGGQGISRGKGNSDKAAGFISLPDVDIYAWDMSKLKKLASMSPGSLVCLIQDSKVTKTYQLQVPPRLYNFPDISCKNKDCISHPSTMQHEVQPYFLRAKLKERDAPALAFVCKYCETLYDFWQIWDYKSLENQDFLASY